MSLYTKRRGTQGEEIAWKWYKHNGYTLVEKNYTIRGGEIDLLLSKDDVLVCVEVKVIDYMDDLHGYITKKKLYHLQKTLERYVLKNPISLGLQIDIVFVKQDDIVEIFHNVTE